jgi:hypothetical protein
VHTVLRSEVTAPEDIEGICGFDEFANAASRPKWRRSGAALIVGKIYIKCRSEGMVAESADFGTVFQSVPIRSWRRSTGVSSDKTTLIGQDQMKKIFRFPFREKCCKNGAACLWHRNRPSYPLARSSCGIWIVTMCSATQSGSRPSQLPSELWIRRQDAGCEEAA